MTQRATQLVCALFAGVLLLSVALTTTTATSAADSTPWCTTHDFRITQASEQAALGTFLVQLSYRNITGRACLTGGFPGVTLWGVRGRKLGIARRVDTPNDRVVLTVKPGSRVFDTIAYHHFPNPFHACRVVKSASIYAPNSTQSSTVSIRNGSVDCDSAPAVYAMQPSRHGLG